MVSFRDLQLETKQIQCPHSALTIRTSDRFGRGRPPPVWPLAEFRHRFEIERPLGVQTRLLGAHGAVEIKMRLR